jgi:hypothetical protein
MAYIARTRPKEDSLIGTAPLPTFDTRASILAALERAGWQIDADEPHVMEASDGEVDMQHSEDWAEAPGILAPEEVARLFGDEEGEQG